MGQIMAVDYGKKRCGIAVTDDMQMIATGLPTVDTQQIFQFCTAYFAENKVEELVVGLPTDLKGNLSEVEQDILGFISQFKTQFPEIAVQRFMKDSPRKWLHFISPKAEKTKRKEKKKG